MKLSGKYVCLFVFLLFAWFSHAQTNKTLDSLNLVLKNAKHDTTRVEVLIEISEFFYNSYPDTVISICNKAITMINNNISNANNLELKSYLNSKAAALNNCGLTYHLQGNSSKALNFCFKSLKIQEEIHGEKEIAYILRRVLKIAFFII